MPGAHGAAAAVSEAGAAREVVAVGRVAAAVAPLPQTGAHGAAAATREAGAAHEAGVTGRAATAVASLPQAGAHGDAAATREAGTAPSYVEVVKARNISFADKMRVREEEARHLAELNTAMAVERLEEIERLKCEVESETARALVVEQNTQIARLTERLESKRIRLESQRIRLELTAGAQQMRAAVDEELKSTPVGTPPRAVPIEVGWLHRWAPSKSSR